MTRTQARDVVCTMLHEVAPEADLDHFGADVTLQESLGLDSLDFLNFVAGLQHLTGVEIHEHDYPRLLTLDECVSFLVSATRPAGA